MEGPSPKKVKRDSTTNEEPPSRSQSFDDILEDTLSEEALEQIEASEGNLVGQSEAHVHYYVKNFKLVLDEVQGRYLSLLYQEEKDLLEKWRQLSYPAQQLYVRLYSRKPIWFPVTGLDERYREIEGLSQYAIPELIQSNFAVSSASILPSSCSAEDKSRRVKLMTRLLYSVLRQSDMDKIIRRASLSTNASVLTKRRRSMEKLTKLQMARLIASHYYHTSTNKIPTQRAASFSPSSAGLRQRTLKSFFGSVTPAVSPASPAVPTASPSSQFLLPNLVQTALPGDCLSLSSESVDLFRLIQHLFFLSPWQDQSLLVLADMDMVKYPPLVGEFAAVTAAEGQGLFRTREELEAYQRSLFLEMELTYALQRLHPSQYKKGKSGGGGSNGGGWVSVDEVGSALDNLDEGFLLRYHYPWQCQKEPTLQHTLYRIIHHCALHLCTTTFDESLDPYRNLPAPPPSLGEQMEAMIAAHSNTLHAHPSASLTRAVSQPHLPQAKENIENASVPSTPTVTVKAEPIPEDDTNVVSSATVPSASTQEQPHWTDRYRENWVLTRILTHAIAELEKQKDYSAVTCLYRLLLGCGRWGVTRRGQWWERLSLVLLSHQKNPAASLSVAMLALEDELLPSQSPDRISLIKRVQRLHKPPLRWKPAPTYPVLLAAPTREMTGQLVYSSVGQKNRWKPLDSLKGLPPLLDLGDAIPEELAASSQEPEGDTPADENSAPVDNNVIEVTPTVGVERLALQWYAEDGWEGLHCEGGLIYPLFSMMTYPVFFSNVPMVFQTRFQDAPLDLLSQDFYEQRKDSFEALFLVLAEETNEQLAQRLESCWAEHRGETIRSVEWRRYPLILLQNICACFGGKRLSNLFRIIAQNYKASRAGMPDLLLWKTWVDENDTMCGDILFSEIKGPRDRLSSKQYLWLHRMLEVDIPVEVLYVKEEK